jgi:hypothetical protein
MLSAGVLMVVLGVIAFFIEWCVLFHCRPRDPLEINGTSCTRNANADSV